LAAPLPCPPKCESPQQLWLDSRPLFCCTAPPTADQQRRMGRGMPHASPQPGPAEGLAAILRARHRDREQFVQGHTAAQLSPDRRAREAGPGQWGEVEDR
jgi:hypothetical protein